MQIFWTAGAIVSSLDDLNTFYRALFSGRLLPAAQMSELKTPAGSGRSADPPPR